MITARITLITIFALATTSGILSFKTRNPVVFYKVDTTNPISNLRLCTFPFITAYTTVEAEKAQGAPTLYQTDFFTTPVYSSVCPAVSIWICR